MQQLPLISIVACWSAAVRATRSRYLSLLAAIRWAVSQSRCAASAAATCAARISRESTRAVVASRARDIARFWESRMAVVIGPAAPPA
jgi:hypothetical protein